MEYNEKFFDFIECSEINHIIDVLLEENSNMTLETKIDTTKLVEGHYVGATLIDFIMDIKENITKYKQVYESLYDKESKSLFLDILKYRCSLSTEALACHVSDRENIYFEKSLLPRRCKNVFVDCGAKEGGSVKRFIKKYGAYKRIYAYEPLDINFSNLSKEFVNQKEVYISNKAVCDGVDERRFTISNSLNSNKLDTKGEKVVQTVSLDKDILEPISYIKMDIEGGEVLAIEGCKYHIMNDNPQLSICVYHVVDDIWRIWDAINSINSNYQYSLRYYGTKINEKLKPYGIVLYAEPKKWVEYQ